MLNTIMEIHIGSTGFSQFGKQEYYEKSRFEGKWLLKHYSSKFILPTELNFKWKRCPYEGDSYHELIVWFDEKEVIEGTDKFIEIWNLINKIEDYDIESLEEQIEKEWFFEQFRLAQEKNDGSHLKRAV